MSTFTNFIEIESIPHINKWINKRDLPFFLSDTLTGKCIVVPRGFIFDGCSIKCPLGQSVEPDTLAPCCLHDYMFFMKMGFWFSNICLYKAMRVRKTSLYKRVKYFLGVTIFGWWRYFEIWKKIKTFFIKLYTPDIKYD